jgi:hypothetical protein
MKPKVSVKSNFSKTIIERVFDETVFMLRNERATLKKVSVVFDVSTTTVWRDMRKRLPLINPDKYKEIDRVINYHKRWR